MTATPSRIRQKLKPGAVVRCRTRRYLVEDVQAPPRARSRHGCVDGLHGGRRHRSPSHGVP